MTLPGVLLLLVSASSEPSPSVRVGPTVALLGSIGGGDAGVGASVGGRGGVRFVFSDSLGAAATFGYERAFDRGGHHRLSILARGEILDTWDGDVVFAKWAFYFQLGALVSIDDDSQPGAGPGLRAGVGFLAVDSKIPLVIEFNWQRQWVQSGPFTSAQLFLGLGF